MSEVRLSIEFVWTPSEEDLAARHTGDAPEDYAERSYQRVLMDALDKLNRETGVSWTWMKRPTLHE